MKYKKLFDWVTKEYVKNLDNPKQKASYGNMLFGELTIDDIGYYGIGDGYRMYFVPKKMFPFDIDKVLRGRTFIDVESCMEMTRATGEYLPAEKTSEMRTVKVISKNETFVKIKNDNTHAWVNVKYMDYFDNDDLCTYEILAPSDYIKVYEEKKLVGIVFPFRMEEDQD